MMCTAFTFGWYTGERELVCERTVEIFPHPGGQVHVEDRQRPAQARMRDCGGAPRVHAAARSVRGLRWQFRRSGLTPVFASNFGASPRRHAHRYIAAGQRCPEKTARRDREPGQFRPEPTQEAGAELRMNGVVSIATGRYSVFVSPLVEAIRSTGFCDRLFVLTDDPDLLARPVRTYSGGFQAEHLPWGALAWPYPTLWRYHAISAYAPRLSEVDQLLYLDIDMRPLVACPELFTHELVAVTHPGYWNSPIEQATFSKDPKSNAHHAPRLGDTYVAGGVQGGQAETFLSVSRHLAGQVEDDHRRGVLAVWHDESHWNRFVNTDDTITVVGPEFCWPEDWTPVPEVGQPRIEALNKDHHEFRGTKPTVISRLSRLAHGLRRA